MSVLARKPDSLSDFLNEFITELKDVIANGFGKLKVNLLGFCCDTPAKSYILVPDVRCMVIV